MSDDHPGLRALLERNVGFDDPDSWVEYARRHGFKRVTGMKVARCPDCSGAPRRRPWGQYVYYSTLIRLQECADCGLVWADVHIDPETTQQHFEVSYKDDEYFRTARRTIFDHLVEVIDRVSPRGARVLDIGGARGDLMSLLRARRPDVTPTVNDLSKAATAWAADHFDFSTLTGGALVLAGHREVYDVVVLSDTLYYEPHLAVLWGALPDLVRQGGSVVIRVPNKYVPIKFGQLWYRLAHTRARQLLQDRVRGFNPEHIFIFTQGYLRNRLARIGFSRMRVLPSPSLPGREPKCLRAAVFHVATMANRVSGHRLVLTPSMVVVGTARA